MEGSNPLESRTGAVLTQRNGEQRALKRVRLAYLVSHPIQYQAPLLRRIAQEKDIELTVFFTSDFSVGRYKDIGFGVEVGWDVPLLDGYDAEFLPSLRDKRRTGVATQINYGILSRLRGSRKKLPYDVLWVHGYSTVNAWHGMIAGKMLGIPVLLRAETWMGSRFRSKQRLAVKTLFFFALRGFVSATLSIGTRNSAYWSHYLGEQVPQFQMPYAVDNAFFQRTTKEAGARRLELREELRINSSRPVILFASKLQERKCCADLIEAYKRLAPGHGVDSPAYLVIAGDGEERNALERQAAESGLSGIRFCGFRNQAELARYFDLASVFVLPSRHEPWGLVVNEAMNAGCAIVLSDEVGCQVDLVREGIEGCVFSAGDVTALTAALQRVLASRETTTKMGMCARQRIQSWNFEEDVRGLRCAIAEATGRDVA